MEESIRGERKIKTHHAKCEKCESTEQAKTSQFMARNSSALSLNAMISVGQTKVLENERW